MNYRKKYAKYFQKNKKLIKSFAMIDNKIGGNMDKSEILKFFKRAKGSIIENDYDILFNMCLVKYKVRPAFLLQLIQYSEEQSKDLIPTIKNIYTEFKFTPEGSDQMFIHIDPLTKRKGDVNKWIGKNLGFHCAGLSDNSRKKNISYAINYILHIPDIDPIYFYAEVCRQEKYNEEHFSTKLKSFDSFAQKLGWNVEMFIQSILPFSYFLDLLVTNQLTKEHENYLVHMLRGNGTVSIYENINANVYTFDDLLKNKELLLFKILESIYNPLEIFWPLQKKFASDLRQIETQIFSSLDRNPIDMYNEFINAKFVKEFIDVQSKQNIRHMNKIKHKLFSEYKKQLMKFHVFIKGQSVK